MAVAPLPNRILPLAVVGARTNKGTLREKASALQWIEGNQVACVDDTLIDPVDGEIAIVTRFSSIKDDGKSVAALGNALSNGSFIVDTGQGYVYCVEYGDRCGTMPAARDAFAMRSCV